MASIFANVAFKLLRVEMAQCGSGFVEVIHGKSNTYIASIFMATLNHAGSVDALCLVPFPLRNSSAVYATRPTMRCLSIKRMVA